MQKIKDERLKLKNLQNIRIAYGVQTLGIWGILGYEWATKGIDGMTKNPLWFVFILTSIVSASLSMDIGVAHEGTTKSPKKGLLISLVILTGAAIVLGILGTAGEEFTVFSGILLGGIVFISGLVPILYLYHVRKKNRAEESNEKETEF